MKNKINLDALNLRQGAEKLLGKIQPKTDSQLSEPDVLKLMHEVEVQQIEMELQQEELIWDQDQASKTATENKDKDFLIAADITKSNRGGELLIESEIRYRRLFESAKDGILFVDVETGMIMDANPSLIEMLGDSKEQFIEKAIWEIRFFKDIVTNPDEFSEFRQKEYVHYDDLPLETADGRKLNVEFVSNVYLVDEKKVIQCDIRDITQRKRVEAQTFRLLADADESHRLLFNMVEDHKQTEAALRKSEARLRTLLQTIPDLIWLKDCEGAYLSCNTMFERFFGAREADIIGKTDFDFVNRQQADFFREHDRKAMAAGKPTRNEEWITFADDNHLAYLETIKMPVFDSERTLIGILGIGRDMTERKQVQEELDVNRRQLRNIIEFLPDATVAVDKEKHIIIWNKAVEEMTGIPETEMIGKGPEVYMVPFYGEAVPSLMDYAFTDFREIPDKYYNIIREGDTIMVEVYCNALYNNEGAWIFAKASSLRDESGKIIGAIESFRDITVSKIAAQELVKAKEHAEESDRLKSTFLANMSHEIRTPMNGILGFAGLLKEPNLSGEEQQEYIRIIEKSGARMLNIINDIVSISKVESGQMEISISETNINEQIEYIYTFFKPEASPKGIELFFKNSLPVKDAIIKTDREKIYAILTNLVKNAIKFTQAGSIEFGYNLKPVNPQTQGVAGEIDEKIDLEFFVKDTGLGIRQEQKEFIFERFRQGSESLNRNYEGAGLGLAISKAYVKMLGGKIWVESEIGKGSTFYFTIPYDGKQEEKNWFEKVAVAGEDSNQMKKLKILIADDDGISEKFIVLTFRMYGKEILNVKTGVEAIEACRNNPDIDLVMMDIKMPEMDGYEATRQIRKFNKDVVIIAQTAFALAGDKEKAIAAGCNDYIAKPFGRIALVKLMKKYF